MEIIKNNENKGLYRYVLPWVETHFPEPDINGYVCMLQRKDDPTFVEFFKEKRAMWDRVEEIERKVQFPSKMEVLR